MLELCYKLIFLIVPYQRILQCKRSSVQGINRIQSIEDRDDVPPQKCEAKSGIQDRGYTTVGDGGGDPQPSYQKKALSMHNVSVTRM